MTKDLYLRFRLRSRNLLRWNKTRGRFQSWGTSWITSDWMKRAFGLENIPSQVRYSILVVFDPPLTYPVFLAPMGLKGGCAIVYLFFSFCFSLYTLATLFGISFVFTYWVDSFVYWKKTSACSWICYKSSFLL